MSVISSIVCLLLDPFFRTIAGFQVLIEKEWIAYGYPISWSEEASQYSGSSTEDSLAPISFIQFLDATWQLWTAFPSAFEFTDDFVLFILDNACSSRFGTLECSHDDERFFTIVTFCSYIAARLPFGHISSTLLLNLQIKCIHLRLKQVY